MLNKKFDFFLNFIAKKNAPIADDTLSPVLLTCGSFFGGTVVMALLIGLIAHYGHAAMDLEATILLFRPTGFIWLFLFLFSLNVYGWQKNGVNSVLIFEINPRDRLTHWHLAAIAWFFAFLWERIDIIRI